MGTSISMLRSFPKEGCSLSSVKWNTKEDLSLVPIIVVECYCIFIINYCWQTPRASFAFGLCQMLTFHINLRSVETKRWHARLVLLLFGVGFGLKKGWFRMGVSSKSPKTSSDMFGFEKML